MLGSWPTHCSVSMRMINRTYVDRRAARREAAARYRGDPQSPLRYDGSMTSSTFYNRPSTKIDLDIEELIREVHYRPAIWNKNCVEYTDRRLKARMWDEVCESIIDNWKQLKMLQQNTISVEVQKKWRNVKDTFNKEMKKKTAGQDLGRKRQYIHFKALSFLSNAERHNSTGAVSLDGSDDESDSLSLEQENANRNSARKRTRNKYQEEDEGLVLVKRENFQSDEDNSNSEFIKDNTDKYYDNSLEIDLGKINNSEDNVNLTTKKSHNREEYLNRHFVEIKCDEWDNERSNHATKRNHDKYFLKDRVKVKVYDEDVSFTEMMVPMLRQLDDDQKHFAKIEILNILHKAKSHQPSSSSGTQTERDKTDVNEGDD